MTLVREADAERDLDRAEARLLPAEGAALVQRGA
jgi:hypothetical protein